jgi:hypothetical protein
MNSENDFLWGDFQNLFCPMILCLDGEVAARVLTIAPALPVASFRSKPAPAIAHTLEDLLLSKNSR